MECEALKSSKLSIKSLKPDHLVNVNVTDIHFNKVVWSAMYCNLYFINCNMKSLELILVGQVLTSDTHLGIKNSFVGANVGIKWATARFDNCSFDHVRNLNNQACILALNSTVTIKNSQVTDFHGGFFLQINMGVGFIMDVEFVNCVSTNTLVSAIHKSFVSVANCTFHSNYNSLIDVEHFSFAVVENTCFLTISLSKRALSHFLLVVLMAACF